MATTINHLVLVVLFFTLAVFVHCSGNNFVLNTKTTTNGLHEHHREKIMGWVVGIFTGLVAAFLSVVILLDLFYMVVKKKSDNYSSPTIFSKFIKAEDLAFLDEDYAVSALTLVGRGGCGEVYKTDIPNQNITTIAIKKVIQPSKGAAELAAQDTKALHKKMRQIRSEIQTVGQIRHRNLVPLLAHLSRTNCHYLVYEYMENKSLQHFLRKVQAGERQLDWLTRHKIATGVISGLEYLHMSHTPRIVHRDLKPDNVLLDADMEARITDFGLAILIPEANTHMTMSDAAGTLGYIAPEYYETNKLSEKCDIYSFGVLLGVLVTGKFPSDEFFWDTNGLPKWMREVMNSDNPRQAIDPLLLDNRYEKQMLLALKIACYCTHDNPKDRPDSKTCRKMLAEIKHAQIENSGSEHSGIEHSQIEISEIVEISEISSQ